MVFRSINSSQMIVISMEIIRYIIWVTSLEDTNQIMEILTPHSSIIVSITDVIICIESTLSVANIRGYVGDELEMVCIELSEKFIEKLLKTKFVEEEQNNFRHFLKLTKVPQSINEGLDLINELGGVKYLNERELAAMDKLTNKSD